MSENQEEPPRGELELRSAELVAVSFPERTIELIVMPYEREAQVVYQGRVIREIVSRGAFDGIERRANRVRVNRDHDVTRTIGRATRLHPSRDEGLVAEIRIARTELGEETLTLADEGLLDASAGFLPMPGGETWRDRGHRRLTRIWLGHIAMTPDPAYQDARVLAVRSNAEPLAASATPNRDRLALAELEAEYARIDARYARP